MTMTASDRDPLMIDLRRLWEQTDPVPADLADTMIAAIEATDIDAEYELMTLVQRSNELVGTRLANSMSIEFAYNDVSVLIRVGELDDTGTRRIDGWIAPQEGTMVRLTHDSGSLTCGLVDGRFEFDDVPEGLIRLFFSGPDDDDVSLATPTFEI